MNLVRFLVFPVSLFIAVNTCFSQNFEARISEVHQLANTDRAAAALAFSKISKKNRSPNELAQYNWYKAFFCEEKDSVLHYASVPQGASIPHQAMLLSLRGLWYLSGQWKPNKTREECQKAYNLLITNPVLFNDFQQLYITLNMAVSEFALGNYNNAGVLANEKADRLINAPCGNWTNKFLNSIVLCNVTSNRHDIAQLCGDKAMKCFEEYPKLIHARSASLFNNLGQMNIVNANYYKALQYQLKAKEILDEFNDGNYNYEWYWHMGWLNTEVGNFTLAESYIQKARELIIAQEGVDSYDHFLINLVDVDNLLNSKKLSLARPLLDTVQHQVKLLNVQGDNYINYIETEGLYHEIKGDYKKAITLYEKVLKARLEQSGTQNFFVLQAYKNLIGMHFVLGNFEEAKSMVRESKEIIDTYFKKAQFPEVLDILLDEIKLLNPHKTAVKENLYKQIIKLGADNNHWLLAGYSGLATLYFNTYKTTKDKAALLKSVDAVNQAYLHNNQSLYFLNNIHDRLHYENDTEELLQTGTEIADAFYRNFPSEEAQNLVYKFIDHSKHNAIRQQNEINRINKINGISTDVFNEEKRLKSEIVSLQKLMNLQTDGLLRKQYIVK